MSFKQVIGQESVIRILTNSIKNSRLPHALLFCGPDGVGKRLVAKELSKVANCENNGSDSCDECASCRKIDRLNHPDVVWIENDGGSIGIDQIRWLRHQINLKPYEARVKVFVIVEADLMTEEAQNALLKTLEEPPPRSHLILTSSNSGSLLSTINSRCQILKFATLSLKRLKDILTSRHGLDSARAHFLAHLSGGRLGRALELIDEEILVKKNKVIDGLLSLIRSDEPLDWQDEPKDEIAARLQILSDWYRDLLLLKEGNIESLIHIDRAEDLTQQKDGYSHEELIKIVDELNLTRHLIRQNLNPKIALEVLMRKLKVKKCLR